METGLGCCSTGRVVERGSEGAGVEGTGAKGLEGQFTKALKIFIVIPF